MEGNTMLGDRYVIEQALFDGPDTREKATVMALWEVVTDDGRNPEWDHFEDEFLKWGRKYLLTAEDIGPAEEPIVGPVLAPGSCIGLEVDDRFRGIHDGVNLYVKKLRECGFTDEQIKMIFDARDEVCPHCLDAESGCFCWNDE